jgi:hypothetical protein
LNFTESPHLAIASLLESYGINNSELIASSLLTYKRNLVSQLTLIQSITKQPSTIILIAGLRQVLFGSPLEVALATELIGKITALTKEVSVKALLLPITTEQSFLDLQVYYSLEQPVTSSKDFTAIANAAFTWALANDASVSSLAYLNTGGLASFFSALLSTPVLSDAITNYLAKAYNEYAFGSLGL